MIKIVAKTKFKEDSIDEVKALVEDIPADGGVRGRQTGDRSVY